MKSFFLVLSIVALAFVVSAKSFAQGSQYAMSWGHEPNGSSWQTEGNWTFGGKSVHELKLASGDGKAKHDGGKTLMGQVKFDPKEGMLGLKAQRIQGNQYSVQTKKGNEDWKSAGTWTIGHRTDHGVILAQLISTDSGKTVKGQMTYAGEGPIHIKGNLK